MLLVNHSTRGIFYAVASLPETPACKANYPLRRRQNDTAISCNGVAVACFAGRRRGPGASRIHLCSRSTTTGPDLMRTLGGRTSGKGTDGLALRRQCP